MTAKRSIFEEVSETSAATQSTAPKGGMIDARPKGARKAIRIWLFVIFALVAAMVLVGGATRLTDSGLSITEWKPVTGAIPPMTEADWQKEFTLYQATPQYALVNAQMTLSQFKGIYWWEWAHRQLGRTIGLIWALGFVFFWATGRIPRGWWGRLFLVGVLGGMQGLVGWWMVSSGLVGDMVRVASYRLATHLGLAFLILMVIGWYAMLLGRSEADLLRARREGDGRLAGLAGVVLTVGFVQVLLGALVAGIDAGRGFTDWPLMGGDWLPPDPFSVQPLWRNFFEDPGLVQFDHRVGGYLLFIAAVTVALRGRCSPHASVRVAFAWMGAWVFVQAGLGIVTLMYGAPLSLGLVHQTGAIVAIALILRARFMARYPVLGSVRDRG